MPKQRFITRRRFVAAGMALVSAAKLQRAAQSYGAAAGAPVCTLAPEQEVGPYYIADELLRSDITEGKPGVPLSLRIAIMDARTCKPLSNAAVDLWHCDALGLYSGFTKQNPMGPGGPPHGFGPPPSFGSPARGGGPGPGPGSHPIDKLTFLRGIQLSDSGGIVSFQTVFPGFYVGRTNHIHFEVRVGGHAAENSYQAGHVSHTGQIFFPEELASQLMENEPYSRHRIHRTTQMEDGIFGDQHGGFSVARISPVTPGDFTAGLHADLIAAVDPSATPAAVERRGPPGRWPHGPSDGPLPER